MQEDYEVGVSNRFSLLLDEDVDTIIEQISEQKKTHKVTSILPDGNHIKINSNKTKTSSKLASIEEDQLLHTIDVQQIIAESEPGNGSGSKQLHYQGRAYYGKRDSNLGEIHSHQEKFEYDNELKVNSKTETSKYHGFQGHGHGNFSGSRGRTFYKNRGDKPPYCDYRKENHGKENSQRNEGSYHGRYYSNSSYHGSYQYNRYTSNEEEYVDQEYDQGGTQNKYLDQYPEERSEYENKKNENSYQENDYSYGNYQKRGQGYFKKPYYGQSYGNNYKNEGYAVTEENANPEGKVEDSGEVHEYQGRNDYYRENQGYFKPGYRGRYNRNYQHEKETSEEGDVNYGYQARGKYHSGKPRGYYSYQGNSNYHEQNQEEWYYEQGVESRDYQKRGGGYKSNYRGRGNRGGYYNNYSYTQYDYNTGYNREIEQVSAENEDQANEPELRVESIEIQQESTELATSQTIGEHQPDAWYLEAEKALTLSEFRAMQGDREKPVFNLRQAGEGEDTHQWQSMYALENKKTQQDMEEEEKAEPIDIHQVYPQRAGRQKQLLDINIRFSDSRSRGRGRGRGGRGGREARDFHQDSEHSPIEWCEPTQRFNQYERRTYTEETAVPPKFTSYSGYYRNETETWPQVSERDGDYENNHQFMNRRGGNRLFNNDGGYKSLAALKVDDEKDFPPLC